MIEDLKNVSPEFLSPHQKRLLELAAVGVIYQLPPRKQTLEEAREELQAKDADRRARNMKSGQSRIDVAKLPILRDAI